MEQIVKNIMKNNWIYPVFQPIVSLRDGNVVGYEALSRISDDAGREYKHISIEEIFVAAEKSDLIWNMDYLCRKNAMKEYFGQNELEEIGLLFLNVCPRIMEDQRFSTGFTRDYLKRFYTKPENIVFEITEREAIKNKTDFQKLVHHYKKQGFDIAIDDVGSAYSGLERICYSNPDYIKLDMSLVRGIHNNHIKEALVRGMMDFATSSNMQVIAEGIETKEELEKLIHLGVHYGQGYYLAYPQRYLSQPSEEVVQTIYIANQKRHKLQNYSVARYYIKNITFPTLTVSSEEKIGDIQEHLEKKPEIPGVCVCMENKVQGVLTREKLAQMLGGRFGFSLYQNRAVSLIMNKDFLSVDVQTPISVVSEIAMKREKSQLYDFIVVTQNSEYYGVVTIKDLLTNATQINLMAARDANPLTGLPGNVVIENEIETCLERNEEYSILYLDLDNFKAFNDRYGFECGDKVICAVADTLHDVFDKGEFIGHIGGDDFVVILSSEEWGRYIEKIDVEFRKRIQPLYSKQDWEQGYIIAANRKGEIEKFPVVSITTVAVTSREKSFCSHIEVTKELAARKKQEKKRRSLKFT